MDSRFSIRFDDVDTWVDWGLIPTSRPVFNPPSLKSKYIDLPGIDGGIDLTAVFSGPKFGARTGSFEFFMSDKSQPFETLKQMIINHLHGKILRATLVGDPNWFYEGRFTLNTFASTESYGKIVIDYICAATKQEALELEDWLWDPFDFEEGEILDLRNIIISGSRDIVVYAPISDTPISFRATRPMVILFKGSEYNIPSGQTTIQEITREESPVSFRVFGDGEITILYRGGVL